MARMIPPSIDPDTPSPGEIEIFRRLKDDPATHGWAVLHSLDVAHHRSQVTGEIDFVVLIPCKGVLCVEVKAHSHIRCLGGQWLFGKRENPGPSPFKQVSAAMHSIREDCVERDPRLSRVPFWSCVILPYVDFPYQSEEWHSWQLIDARAFRARPVSTLLLRVMEQARGLLARTASARWFSPDSTEPTRAQCESIVQILRPEFEVFESPRARRQRDDALMLHFTEEQYGALDAMEDNPRVVFTGPAGTGKTLLAIEAARRASDAGRRTLLACFNDLLGHWLTEQARPLANVVSGTLHAHMLRVAGSPPTAGTPSPTYWEAELPELATERLLEQSDPSYIFDEVIIDEAQDVLRESFLDFLDLSLTGGLAGGRLRLFGDFEKQSIYDAAGSPLQEVRQQRFRDAGIYRLRTNCRNTPRIAALVRLLCDLEPDYSRIRRPDNEIEPQILYFDDEESQQRLLVESLEGLHREGFDWNDVVILSPKRDDRAVATTLPTPWSQRLRPCRSRAKGSIGYCTIQAFKGLEAAAIVITDLDHVDSERARALFYVGLTRAVHRLIVLVRLEAKAEVLDLLLGASRNSPSGEGV